MMRNQGQPRRQLPAAMYGARRASRVASATLVGPHGRHVAATGLADLGCQDRNTGGRNASYQYEYHPASF